MEKNINIHIAYGHKKTILICKPSEFLSKAAEIFRLNKEEIDIYEKNKNTSKKIGVESLHDIINIEIRKKSYVSSDRINGQRSPKSMKMNHDDNEASTSNIPTLDEMCRKLQERNLNNFDIALLVKHLQSLPPGLQRRWESGNFQPVEMKNRKIQASPIDYKLAYTQTDKLIEYAPKETVSSKEEIVKEMKRYARQEKKDPRKVAKLMKDSYSERRNFIQIEIPKIDFIREKYPLLFSLSEVRNELDRIFYFGKSEEFIANIGKYAEVILSMAREDDPLLRTTREKQNALETAQQKRHVVEVGSVLLLSSLVFEQANYLELEDKSINNATVPYIKAQIKFHQIFDRHTFKVFTEGRLICEACDFKEAILCLMGCYFIFYIEYPAANFGTLALMERLYLEGNDTEDKDIDDATLQIIKSLQLKAAARR